jgi:leader peptidase (prepilin peptidase)/N-methyltransferase
MVDAKVPRRILRQAQDGLWGTPYTSGVTMAIWFELIGFGVGLLFGSFLNVCISRLPGHESIVTPRSRCMSCGRQIRWYDNVPVLSWVVLRGRCRDCGAGISWRYPAVELAVGVWFAAFSTEAFRIITSNWETVDFGPPLAVWRAEHVTGLLGSLILGFLLIGLMVMDWQTMRLPDAFTLPGIGIGFLLVCVRAFFLTPGEGDIVFNTTHQLRMSSPGSSTALGNVFMTGTEAMVLGRVAAIAGAALVLLLARWGYKALRGRDGLGLGDVKLLAMIAAFLGFGEALLALLVGVVAASLYGVVLIALRRARGESKLPLGSFLAAGGLFAALFGAQIVGWYMGLLR